MPTYRLTARNQFRSPSGAVGEAPDGPGSMATLLDDVDNYLGIGGAEYCAGSITSIPTSRRFVGKLAYHAPSDTVYRYVGAGNTALGANAPAGAVWQAWEKPAASYSPTFSNLNPGTGQVTALWGINAGVWWATITVTSGSGYSITAGTDINISVPTTIIQGYVAGRGVYYRGGVTSNGSIYDLLPFLPGTGNATLGTFRMRVNAQTGTAAGSPVGPYLLGNVITTPWTGDVWSIEAHGPCGTTA